MAVDRCGASVCIDVFDDYRRDTYATCTLPDGHDGDHRAIHDDAYHRIVLTWVEKDDDESESYYSRD